MSTVFSDDDAAFLRTWIAEATGVVIRPDQQFLIDSRLGPLAARERLGAAELVAAIRARREPLTTTALDTAMNNETSWFRDPAAFDALRDVLLPELVAANRTRRQLSVWSVAASGGQELYSVAMLLAEHFPEVFSSWDLRLVGTDVSAQMVAKARSGRYSQAEMSRGLPSRYLVEYLHRDRLDWVVNEDVRRRVSFEQRNILAGPPPGRFDLVLCRYLLIYFDDATKAQAVDVLRGALDPTGVLLLGGSEMFLPQPDRFATRPVGRSIAYVPARPQGDPT